MSDRRLTVTEAARQFAELIDRAYYEGESTVVLRLGEPVARIVPAEGGGLLGRDFAARWRTMRHLEPEEAESFAEAIQEGRNGLAMPESPWD